MTERDERIEQEAIDWLVRLGEADAGEWEAFTLWLEADPAHAARYEALAAADRDWGALARPARQVPPLPVRRGPSRRIVFGAAIAASLAMGIGYETMAPRAATYAVETAVGEHRTVALADGGRTHRRGQAGGIAQVLHRHREAVHPAGALAARERRVAGIGLGQQLLRIAQ